MKKFKTLLALVAVMMMIVSVFSGCKPAAPAVEEPAAEATEAVEAAVTEAPAAIPGDLNGDGKVVVGYDNMQETENFFQVVKGSLEDAIAARGWEMVYAFAERDPERMIANVDSFLLQGADFIIDFNVVPETGSAQAADLKEKGIPMLSIDCLYDGAYFFGVNNLNAGETAGNAMVAAINAKWDGQLDYILHIYDESAGPEVKKRNSGAGDVLRAAYPSFDPANEIWQDVSDNDPTDARNVITDFLTAHPDAKHIAVVSFTDDRAFAALGGVEASGRMNDVFIVSHNADATAVEHMKTSPEDAWIATVCYNSNLYGELICQVIDKINAGEQVEQMNFNTLTAVTRENVNEIFPN